MSTLGKVPQTMDRFLFARHVVARMFLHIGVAAIALLPLTTAAIDNPVHCGDLEECVKGVVEYVLRLAGIVALAGVVYGGFIYMTAAGTQERIEAGKNAVTYSVVGIIIIGLAYAIVQTVFEALST